MRKRQFNFNIGFPESVNSENQEVTVIHVDPDGSYTGRPKNPNEVPVQDVDDL